ncbi:hypothetical protein S245_010728 [Arachis hypogaea]
MHDIPATHTHHSPPLLLPSLLSFYFLSSTTKPKTKRYHFFCCFSFLIFDYTIMGSFEATNVVVARINKLDPENASLATLVLFICMNTASTIWMIPLGLSGAIRWELQVRWILCVANHMEQDSITC